MSRSRSRHGLALVVALILIALASGLVAVIGLTFKQLVQLDRLESDRAVLRQMIDSGAAWAHRHTGDWPTTDGQPDRLQLNAEGIAPHPCRGLITLAPERTGVQSIERVRVEASLVRPRGRESRRAVVITIQPR